MNFVQKQESWYPANKKQLAGSDTIKVFVSLLYVYSSFKSLRMITTKDKEQLKLKGISEASLKSSLITLKPDSLILKSVRPLQLKKV